MQGICIPSLSTFRVLIKLGYYYVMHRMTNRSDLLSVKKYVLIGALSEFKKCKIDMKFFRKIYKLLSKLVVGKKNIRHIEPSVIFSTHRYVTNKFLIDLSLKAVDVAASDEIVIPNEKLTDAVFYNVFPGEHYRLLKAIAKITNPSVLVEIGTYTGMGSVALMQGQEKGILYTFDVLPWDEFQTHLTKRYFEKNEIIQILDDLSNSKAFEKHREILNQAEIIFMDAPKDGVFEYRFIELLSTLQPKKNKLLILDDIRFINMIDLWVSIESPKLDVSSFGHWSGTGLVDISEGLQIRKT